MRLYAPHSEALTGKWNPPPVTHVSLRLWIANVPVARLVRNHDQHLAGRLLRLPACVDRRELHRLMFEHVQVRQVAEEKLDRDRHGARPI